MDISATTIPSSDQLNSDDLIGGDVVVTVERVTAGSAEQPVNIHLAEFPKRPYRPSKSMRRVLVSAWGKDSEAYTGRRMKLYRDPAVRFGKEQVGGIKIGALSHIDGPLNLALTVTRGKKAPHRVEPLSMDVAASAVDADPDVIAACTDIDELRAMWSTATATTQRLITERVAELQGRADA